MHELYLSKLKSGKGVLPLLLSVPFLPGKVHMKAFASRQAAWYWDMLTDAVEPAANKGGAVVTLEGRLRASVLMPGSTDYSWTDSPK